MKTLIVPIAVGVLLSAVPAAELLPAGNPELDAVIDALLTRGARGGAAQATPAVSPADLLARLRGIDPKALSFDEQIDRRFAETILIGRLVAAPAGKPMGEAAYSRMLREQHLLPYDAAGLWTYAQSQFDATVRELEALARTIDPKKTWRQIADEVKQDHPEPLRMPPALVREALLQTLAPPPASLEAP